MDTAVSTQYLPARGYIYFDGIFPTKYSLLMRKRKYTESAKSPDNKNAKWKSSRRSLSSLVIYAISGELEINVSQAIFRSYGKNFPPQKKLEFADPSTSRYNQARGNFRSRYQVAGLRTRNCYCKSNISTLVDNLKIQAAFWRNCFVKLKISLFVLRWKSSFAAKIEN